MRITCIVVSCVALIYSTGIYAKCAPWTDSEVLKVHKAESIFIARIVSAHIKDIPSQGTILYGDYRLVETLKGKPKESGQLQSYLAVPGVAFTPGFTYLFYVYDGSSVVDWCGGTTRLDTYYASLAGDPETEMLIKLRKMIKQDKAGKLIKVQ